MTPCCLVVPDVLDDRHLICKPNKTVGAATFPSALVTLFEVAGSALLIPVSKNGTESYFQFAASVASIEPDSIQLTAQGSLVLTVHGLGFQAADVDLYRLVLGTVLQ